MSHPVHISVWTSYNCAPRPGREGRQGGRGRDGGHAEAASADRQRQPLRLGRALAALLAVLGGGRRPGRALGDERAAGGAAEKAGMTRYANLRFSFT